jgi:hypothetical protein
METFLNRIRLVAVAAALLVVSAVHASAAVEHRGNQLLAKPWPAPTGHRQPRAADVIELTPGSPDPLDQENASIDRKIQGICRGC